MVTRRLIASGVAIGLLFAAALPVAADAPKHEHNAYVITTLVNGPTPDGDLVNAWGLSRGPTSPWWVADNGTDRSTLYTGNGTKLARVVPIVDGAPTGTVFNGNALAGDFGGDLFLFDGESGNIFGWQPPNAAATVRNGTHAGDAVYKGLAIGTADVGNGPQQYLYATDFHNRRVDIFDRTYTAQTWAGAFVDPRLPSVYAPFGIQNLNGMIFVTYAKTQPGSADEVAGLGRGFVDAFATNGKFLGRVATRGPLNAPWGLAWAPDNFGRFSGDLIVGNFGNGRLHAYRWDGKRWHQDGVLNGKNHKPIAVDGLWAIAFGGGTDANGPLNSLFFAAGPNDENGGAFGTIADFTP